MKNKQSKHRKVGVLMRTCICDQCQKNFIIELKQEKHCKGIKETYFLCKHCNHRYFITITNAEIRRRIKHYKNEWAKMSELKNGREWKQSVWMNKYNKLQKYKAATTQMIENLKVKMNAS